MGYVCMLTPCRVLLQVRHKSYFCVGEHRACGHIDIHEQATTCVDDKWHLSNARGASLVRCTPRTGRTHQIRVHLAAAGNPIVGDEIYGVQVPPAADTALASAEGDGGA